MKEDKEKSIHMYISTLSKLNMIQLIERKILILKKEANNNSIEKY